MSEPASIESELREKLVAYLDGELDGDEERGVEQLLSSDERVRRELQRLQSTWDLLDRLPRADVGANFTRSTVEMVALSVEQEAPRHAPRVGRRLPLVLGGLAVAGLLGFTAARCWPGDNEHLLRDLPVVENLEAYRQTPDVKFLRQLEGTGFFTADEAPAAVADALDQRRARVETLPADQKQELLRKFERFQKLPSAERQRLRQLDGEIARDSQAARLHLVLSQEQRWLDQLAGVERAELVSLGADERLARIKQLRAEEERRLSHEDQAVFADWVEQRLLQRMDGPQRKRVEAEWATLSEAQRRRAVGQRLRTVMQTGRPRPPSERSGNEKQRPRRLWNPEALHELAQRLSPHGQRQLEEAGSPEAHRKLIQQWVREVFYAPGGGRGLALPASGIDEERLKRFFEQELDPSDRAHLLSLPADQMQRQLRRLYHRAHAGRGGR